ncbi:MAG: class I mannose-6-phosphate isomerase [Meiothermus sp.]|uniref:type I phosphomannose isomerase catalytic subunit n=1 Tax=Meiothermus sp. TaxID=1955249 RepID=UPI0025DBF2DA|nr:type I phosphomannose isomerase catalytic subunit [Meiothermus sp.]MCS7058778.1 class I mannose-6-phosphate isomerase [Meiothermus sp.]MCS7195397.1 class I mannose-6-phosphate isomerase [Meiothermus sp.]MCX7740106.1 class I mannose-6-phosphate isomerase [Meiothermus sp.]MDW8091002.1 class I mannose-6-phosphate isomerase [Meiothermus sp.]
MSDQVSALCLEARPVPRVWGGRLLAQRLGLASPEPVGELWLAYDKNPIRSGPAAGRSLSEVLRELGPGFLGEVPYGRYGLELPLLVKFLNTAEWLSVQVHPDDAYAHTVEAGSGFHGKTEAWYVLEGEGEVVYGLRTPLDREDLRRAAMDGSLWGLLNRERVGPGQTIGVPAGTIHALGPGLLLYEVQQRSDLTYRLYDHGRPRELHLEKALDVARLEPASCPQRKPLPAHQKEVLLACEAFVLERHFLRGRRVLLAPEESFLLLTLTRGRAEWPGGPLGWGDTLVLGARRGLELVGEAEFLGAFVPSQERLAWYPQAVRM